MHFLALGKKVINLDRICYVDDFIAEDDEPILAVIMDGLPKKSQPLFLEGDEREALLAVLTAAGAVHPHALADEYVCEDCQREREANCN